MATAQNTRLVALHISDEASPEVFTEIDGIASISLSMSAAEIDVTHLNSTAREYLAGLPERTLNFSGWYDGDDTQQALVYTRFNAGTTSTFKMIFGGESPNEVWQFEGVCTAFNINSETDGAVQFDGTLRIDGAPTITGQ